MLIKPKKIIASPGIYIFRRGKMPLYIGKAANLKQRLASYFRNDEGRTPKIKRMLDEATRLETIETESEIEALIKEAELIKRYRPKYNILMRDDKSYFYVAISKEVFPKIYITHQPKHETLNPKSETRNNPQAITPKRHSGLGLGTSGFRYIGPFTSGGELKIVLKLLRRVFPYCACKRPHKRPCLNSEIGRCPGYCCLVGVERRKTKAKRNRSEYRKNIQNIIAVLSGEQTRLIGRLKREMKDAVKRERYEEAARLRDAIFGLEGIFAHRQVIRAAGPRDTWPETLLKLQTLLKTSRAINRIEGYDISNISGTSATGSMVVFAHGQPDKSQYRKFRIKTVQGISDVGMIKEVLRRRFNHSEWPYPDLVVIDGGKPQLNAALSVVQQIKNQKSKVKSPVMTALAKREEILYVNGGRTIPLQRQNPIILYLFQRIRDESHRFARAYHHKLRKRTYAEAH